MPCVPGGGEEEEEEEEVRRVGADNLVSNF